MHNVYLNYQNQLHNVQLPPIVTPITTPKSVRKRSKVSKNVQTITEKLAQYWQWIMDCLEQWIYVNDIDHKINADKSDATSDDTSNSASSGTMLNRL